MTALLTAESRGTTGPAKNEKIAQAVAECKRLDVIILPPSINASQADFSIEENKVRFGFSAIKNVGSAAITTILQARGKGKFKDLNDFASRVDLSKVNKKTMDSLVKAGAFDEFGKRASLLATYPEIVERVARAEKAKLKNQTSLFGDDPEDDSGNVHMIEVDDFTDREKLMFEKELLGFFLTDHPLNQELSGLAALISHSIAELEEQKEGQKIKVGGLITTVKKIMTRKSNQEMAFFTLEDQAGFSIAAVVFPKTFEQIKILLNRDAVVLIEGKIQFKDDRPIIITDNIRKLSS